MAQEYNFDETDFPSPLQPFLANILNTATDGITAQDKTGKLIYANATAARIVGYPSAQAMVDAQPGEVVNQFELLDEDNQPFPLNQLPGRLALLGKESPGVVLKFRVKASGDESWSYVQSAPVFDKAGQVEYVVNTFHDISSLKQADAALREREARYRNLVENASDMIFTLDSEGYFVSINRAGEALIGYNRDEVALLSLRQMVIPEDIAILESLLQATDANDERQRHELRLRRKDGQPLVLEISTSLFSDDGQATLIQGIGRDVTETKRFETKRRFLAEASKTLVSSLDYETTLTNIAQLITPEIADWSSVDMLDENGEIKRVTVSHVDPEKVALAYQIQREYPIDMNSDSGLPKLLRDGMTQYYPDIPDELLVAGARDERHLYLLRQIGFRSGITVPIVAHGNIYGGLTLVTSTESGRLLKQADVLAAEELGRMAGLALENALAYREAELERERLRVTLTSIGDAVIATDVHGNVNFLNTIAENLTGWSKEEALGRPLTEVFKIINEYSRKLLENPVAKVLETESIVGLANHTILIARDQREIPIEDSAAPIRDNNNTIHGVVLVFRDVTEERKRAEALAELDRAKTEFFSNISHEFRTPLTLMLNPLQEVLGNAAELSPEQAENLSMVHRNSLRLLKLVNSLLDFSRIQSKRIQASFEPTDLSALTTDLSSNFRSLVEQAGLRLNIDCPPLSEAVYVDRDMWEKIVLNLLSNAIKFTFEGQIDVSLQEQGDKVELKIQDTGIGIPKHELPHVLERFHQVRGVKARSHEGSGIGLALVAELVRYHQGEISIESELNKGTLVKVVFPLGSAHLPQEQIRQARSLQSTALASEAYTDEALRWLMDDGDQNRREASSKLDTGILPSADPSFDPNTRILVVDDNADMRGYLSRLLKQNYAVELASDGHEALKHIQEKPISLVITDVMMPNLDGLGLLKKLRADLQTRTLPILLLSARAGEEARIEALQAGADDYLTKPFSAREFLARVESQLQMAQLRSQLDSERQRILEIFESISDAFTALDREFRFTYVNPQALALLHKLGIKTQDAFIEKTIWEVLPNTYDSPFGEAYRRVMTSGQKEQLTAFSPSLNAWLQLSVYPAKEGLSIYFTDVTERENLRLELTEVKEQLAADLSGMTRLYRLSESLLNAPNLDLALEEILTVALEYMGTEKGNIQLVSKTDNRLELAVYRQHGSAFLQHLQLSSAESVVHKAFNERVRLILPDIRKEELLEGKEELDILLGDKIQALQSTPMMSRQGQVIGIINTYYAEPHRPSLNAFRQLDFLAFMAADFIGYAQSL
jgi:PAS domain S-box-containing protein